MRTTNLNMNLNLNVVNNTLCIIRTVGFGLSEKLVS